MKILRSISIGLAVLVCLVVPISAQAFSVSDFVVKPAGASLFYNFDLCGARGYRVTFQAQLEADAGSPVYTRTWHVFEPYRCARV